MGADFGVGLHRRYAAESKGWRWLERIVMGALGLCLTAAWLLILH